MQPQLSGKCSKCINSKKLVGSQYCLNQKGNKTIKARRNNATEKDEWIEREREREKELKRLSRLLGLDFIP